METSRNVDEADREIATTREFAAPKALVFEMWSKLEHLERWYGPQGFSTTTKEFSFKPGGAWIFVMHGPDGRNYDNHNVYVDIVAGERIVYDHVSQPKHRATVTFSEHAGKTRVHMQMLFATKKDRDACETAFHAVEGQQQTLNRLAEQVRSRTAT